MGYADTIPFVSISSTVANTYTSSIPLTSVASDYIDFFRFYTLNYKKPINYAYATLIIPTYENTNANPNYIDGAGAGYLEISDGVTTKNCGIIQMTNLYIKASTTAYNEYNIPLSTNIAGYLEPNTLYYCALKNISSLGNNLILYMPRVEIKMFGNI